MANHKRYKSIYRLFSLLLSILLIANNFSMTAFAESIPNRAAGQNKVYEVGSAGESEGGTVAEAVDVDDELTPNEESSADEAEIVSAAEEETAGSVEEEAAEKTESLSGELNAEKLEVMTDGEEQNTATVS